MLLKLIKHNLKPILKSILPFALALLASVLLFNLTAYEPEFVYKIVDGRQALDDVITASQFQQFIHGLSQFMISCSLILLVAVTIRAIWMRFKSSFYGDEAYLTHTLPVSRATLWKAEICSILISFLSILAVVTLSCLLLALTQDGLQLLESLGLIGGCTHCLGEYYNVKPMDLSFYLSFILVVFTEFTFLTFCGIFGIIMSNRLSKNISLLTGLVTYFAANALLVGLFFLIGQLDPTLLDIFQTSTHGGTFGYDLDLSFMSRTLFVIGSIYCCYCVAFGFINQKLLAHGVNLD